MPTQSKTVDKFQLVQILSILIAELEDDRLKTAKVSFTLTATGMYNVSVFFAEK